MVRGRSPRGRIASPPTFDGDHGIVCHEPRHVAQSVFDDLLVADRRRGGRRLPSSKIRSADRRPVHPPDKFRVDDDDEAQHDRSVVSPPRRRMHQHWRPDDVTHDPVHDRHRVLDLTQLDQPRRGAARPGELEMIVVEPDDEHLGLDWALDLDVVDDLWHRCSEFASHRVHRGNDSRPSQFRSPIPNVISILTQIG